MAGLDEILFRLGGPICDFLLGYDATGVTVTIDVVRMFPDVAATFNQLQASTGLMGFGTGGTDALTVYNQILLLDADAARAAFDLTSGEIYPVLVASELRRGGPGGPLSRARPCAPRWRRRPGWRLDDRRQSGRHFRKGRTQRGRGRQARLAILR